MRLIGRSLAPGILLCLILLAQPLCAEEIDSFYLGLLRSGESALSRQDHARAAGDLEVACFGLLDSPERLAAGLGLLLIAQGGLNDAEAVRATFDRLIDLDERFEARAEVFLSADQQSTLESTLLDYLPSEILGAGPYGHLVVERQRQMLGALAPKEREQRLIGLVAAEPGFVDWQLMLAAAQLSKGDSRSALSTLDRLVERFPLVEEGRCQRLTASALEKRCATIADDVRFCPVSPLNEKELREALLCLESGADLASARMLISRSDPAALASPRVRKLEDRLAALELASQTPETEEVQADDDLESMQKARLALIDATDAAVLENELAAFGAVADRHPNDPAYQQLAGELAYRSSQWRLAAEYLGRAVGAGVLEPDTLFYLAISLYESGDATAAGPILRQALPGLQNSDFVEEYSRLILGDDHASDS